METQRKVRGGSALLDLDGGYVECGCKCAAPPKGGSEVWCVASCEKDDQNPDACPKCSCHLYRYKRPPKGQPVPPKKEWEHVWKPGDPKHSRDDDYNYECLCVRTKPKAP
jgi:hypothetical protein